VLLDFAFLADGAVHRPDGKLDVFGAGFDTILAPTVPAQHPRITLALRVLVSPEEVRELHQVDVVVRAVEGDPIAEAHSTFQPNPEAASHIPTDRLAGIGLVMNFDGLVFPAFGTYEFVITWDNNPVRDPLRLGVAQLPDPGTS
jgi:hypothetical protein